MRRFTAAGAVLPMCRPSTAAGRRRPRGRLRSGRGRAGEVEAREEERDFRTRRLGCVRAVDRVLLDVGAELAPDRALWRLLRVGRAHELAPARDRAVALEHADEDGPRAHEAYQVPEEAAFPVNGVEALGVARRELEDTAGHEREPTVLDHG